MDLFPGDLTHFSRRRQLPNQVGCPDRSPDSSLQSANPGACSTASLGPLIASQTPCRTHLLILPPAPKRLHANSIPQRLRPKPSESFLTPLQSPRPIHQQMSCTLKMCPELDPTSEWCSRSEIMSLLHSDSGMAPVSPRMSPQVLSMASQGPHELPPCSVWASFPPPHTLLLLQPL